MLQITDHKYLISENKFRTKFSNIRYIILSEYII